MAFDDWNWDGILQGVVKQLPAIGATIYGANEVADANKNAAGIAENTAATNRAAVEAANAKAVGMLKPAIDAGAPATEYFKTVMAQPSDRLTPQQQIQLADTTRTANRTLPTALRGSGRAVSMSINDTVDRAKAGMLQTNQNRADSAAGRLQSTGASSLNNAAGITAGQGGQMVNINTAAGDNQANAALGTADATNAAMGNIAAYFANAQKQADRAGAYGSAKDTLAGA